MGSSNRRRAEFVCLHAGVRGRVQSARPVTVVCVDGRRTSIGDAGASRWVLWVCREACREAKGTAVVVMSDGAVHGIPRAMSGWSLFKATTPKKTGLCSDGPAARVS